MPIDPTTEDDTILTTAPRQHYVMYSQQLPYVPDATNGRRYRHKPDDTQAYRATRPSCAPRQQQVVVEEPVSVQAFNPWKRIRGWVLISTIIIVTALIIWNQIVIPGWQGIQNHWQYGAYPIAQVDRNVGHYGNVSSHFLASYYDGRITIIEIDPADPSKNQIYTLSGFVGSSDSHPIIALTFDDRNNLIIGIEGATITLVNTGTGYKQANA